MLPPGMMPEVQYERLVEDFANQARKIIAHCGLDWDDACLRFYETSRPVHTASFAQVRQPIYRHALRRWQPEPELLRPLIKAPGLDRHDVVVSGLSFRDSER